MRNVFWGFALVLLGVLILLDNLGVADFGEMIRDYWPLLLIFWGLSVLIRRRNRSQATPVTAPSSAPPDPDASGWTTPGTPGETPAGNRAGKPYTMEGDLIHQSEVFGDTEMAITSQNFLGGSISSIFGDTFIDLTGITIAEGEHTLRIHTVFGDTRIRLPQNAAITITASGTFGSSTVLGQYRSGFSSFMVANTPEYATASNRLKIAISRVFGDLYVQ